MLGELLRLLMGRDSITGRFVFGTAPAAIVRFRALHDVANGCWTWRGALNQQTGYGVFRGPHGKAISAHRYSFTIYNGEIPEGASVLHRCDNRACVNPGHLYAGDQKQNVRDMDDRGRRINSPSLGEAHGRAVLTDRAVMEMRASSESDTALAKRYNVSLTTIGRARSGKTWRHLNG